MQSHKDKEVENFVKVKEVFSHNHRCITHMGKLFTRCRNAHLEVESYQKLSHYVCLRLSGL